MPSRVHRVRTKRAKVVQVQATPVESVQEWVLENRQQVLGAAVAIAVAVLIVIIYSIVSGRAEQRGLVLLEEARQSDNIETRISSFENIINSYSGTTASYEAMFLLGNAYYDAGKYDESAATFEKLLKKYPKSYFAPMAEEGLAYIAEAKGDSKSAIDHFTRITKIYPKTIVAHRAFMALGKLYEKLGDTEKAAQAYDDLVSTYPGSTYADEASKRYKKLKPPELADDAQTTATE
ncbi:MAG: tetratricopeptide repeat protein [Candidatus Hydrogenedentes bacterium]|nr:tetratricopeptide repeat protein [Candidatus Hydrogenedentota bacterium]